MNWCMLASALMACAVWMALKSPPHELIATRHGGNEGGNDGSNGVDGDSAAGDLSPTLVLGLVSVAVRQGTSIPVALDEVGRAISGSHGTGMQKVAAALRRGIEWEQAWRSPCGDTADGRCMKLLQDTLHDAWVYGSSPVEGLETAIEAADRAERAAIEQNAARLSVRLLIPTGLCFLPAFIAIGVVPSIVSFL